MPGLATDHGGKLDLPVDLGVMKTSLDQENPMAKRKMSAKQKSNIARLKKASAHCRVEHKMFTKSFGKCMKDWFAKN